MDENTQKYICNILRQGTVKWSGRSECLKLSRRKRMIRVAKNGKLISKFEYQCSKCKNFFEKERVEVDHIVEVGPFKGDFNEWIERLFCSMDNLQVLCVDCHQIKTSNYNATLKYRRK